MKLLKQKIIATGMVKMKCPMCQSNLPLITILITQLKKENQELKDRIEELEDKLKYGRVL